MDIAELKRSSNKLFEKVSSEVKRLGTSNKFEDPDAHTFWVPEVDKNGNGFAIIRFLPAPKGEDVPFVRLYSHAFQGPTGKWYIENSRTTLGEQDPVSEYNSKLWQTGSESNKKIARNQKRKTTYISNIMVIKDPAHPENEGKVFRYRYGKKIFDKINDVMYPEFDDEKALNPFDFWEGANFRVKIRNVEGYRNYDKSEFDSPNPLASDEMLDEIWSQQHPLQSLIEPPKFKSYDELKQKMDFVLDVNSGRRIEEETQESTISSKMVEPEALPSTNSEDDDDLEFFRRAAELDE